MNLSHAEVIECNGSIWIIDRDNQYWYFEYEKSGKLMWRYDFFEDFFHLFSMNYIEFRPIIIKWVEEVLNCKVNITKRVGRRSLHQVEGVLNCKVNITSYLTNRWPGEIERVLNSDNNEQ